MRRVEKIETLTKFLSLVPCGFSGILRTARTAFCKKSLDSWVQKSYTALVSTRKRYCNRNMKTTKKKIGELVDIQTGYVFRGKPETSGKGNVRVIQNKDINEGVIHFTKLEKVNFPDKGKRERVRKGDIIFRSRGASYAFILVTEAPSEEVVVASPLQLIRVKDAREVEPAYLAWALTQDDCQAIIESLAQGLTIKTVTKTALKSIELNLPPVSSQRKIAEIATLSAEIKSLNMELAEKQDAYVKAILNN